MEALFTFEQIAATHSDPFWAATRTLRGHTFHGTDLCPQFDAPLRETGSLCAPCCELYQDALLEGYRRHTSIFKKDQEAGRACTDVLEPRTVAEYQHWALSALHKQYAAAGMVAKIDRTIKETGWFLNALPDPIDQEIMRELLYFARSADPMPKKSLYPVDRTAARVSAEFGPVSPEDVRVRIEAAFAALEQAKDGFVEANIEAPLSKRHEFQDPSAWDNDLFDDEDFTDEIIGRIDSVNEWELLQP